MKSFFKNNWLTLLIVLQPILDVVAFFFQNEVATVAGYIRLAIMIAMPAWVLITKRGGKRFWIALAIMAFYSGLHVLNGFRSGYISLYFDLSYLVKVLQMPVLALCFVCLIDDEQTKRQAFRGLWIAAGLLAVILLAAFVTGTGNSTYGEGIGFSGWVINDNRNAHSIILVTLSVFAICLAILNGRRLWAVLIPFGVTAGFLTNGTKGCYYSLFAIFGGWLLFLLLDAIVHRTRLKKRLILALAALMLVSVVIYPYTPRARVSEAQAGAVHDGEIEAALLEMNIDISKMTPEQRFKDPQVREVFSYYYLRYMVGVLPDLFDRFGMDRVLQWFDMSTDVAKLIDTRQIKLCYAGLLWEECDLQTRLVGFEISELGFDGTHDLENDWPALYYYYGYFGLILYGLFVLFFVLRMLRKFFSDFRGSLTEENFSLALSLALLLGLAQFSGAVLRRPNVSIYLALVLGLIWYQTRKEAGADEA
jgi:hypothetical protein